MDDVRTTIAGRRWRVQFVAQRVLGRGTRGDCDAPPGRHPTIRVSRSLGGRLSLDTLVHEVLHASRPELDEMAVSSSATDIARVLWQCGYRLGPAATL